MNSTANSLDRRRSRSSSSRNVDDNPLSSWSRKISILGVSLVVTCVLSSSWLFGYVEPWSQFLAATVIAFGAFIGLGFAVAPKPIRISLPIAFAGLLLAISIVQLVPLPVDALELLSPETSKLRAEFYHNDNLQSSVPISLTPADTRRAVGLGVACLLTLLTGFACLRSTKRINLLFWSVTISAIALGYIGVLCQILGTGVYGFIPVDGGYFGSFGNRNNAAGFFCMALCCSLYLFHHEFIERAESDVEKRSDLTLGLAMLAILQIAAAVCLTTSRGGILALITAIMAYMVFAMPGQLARRVGLSIAVVALIAIPSTYYVQHLGQEELFWQKLGSLTDSDYVKGETRLHHWKDSLNTGQRFLWFGSGVGSYSQVYPLYDSLRIDSVYVHAENLFVETFVEMGVVGISVLTGLLLSVLGIAIRLWKANLASRRISGVLIALVACQLISNSFDFGLFLVGNLLVFCLLLGTILGRAQHVLPQKALDLDESEREEDLSPQQKLASNMRPAHIAMAALLLPGVPALADLYHCTKQQTLGSAGSILTANGALNVDAQFLLQRAKKAVELRPDDPQLRSHLGDSYVRLLAEANRDATTESPPTDGGIGRFLWAAHSAAIEGRQGGNESKMGNLTSSESNRELLKSALHEYRRAAEFCGLNPLVHKRIAQLSFVENDIAGELLSLRRCMSIRAGICREHFGTGSKALELGQSNVAFSAFQECLKFESVYEPSILSLAAANFPDDKIVDSLIPDDAGRLQQAAVHYSDNPETRDLSNRLAARAVSIRTHSEKLPK